MSDFILIFITIFLFSLIIPAVLLSYAIIGSIIEYVVGKLFPPDPLYCDIDPRCHSSFYLDESGKGWIGGKNIT